MTPGLQAFANRDAGFRQFNDRYETVSADPETRREYALWVDESLREEEHGVFSFPNSRNIK